MVSQPIVFRSLNYMNGLPYVKDIEISCMIFSFLMFTTQFRAELWNSDRNPLIMICNQNAIGFYFLLITCGFVKTGHVSLWQNNISDSFNTLPFLLHTVICQLIKIEYSEFEIIFWWTVYVRILFLSKCVKIE